MACSQVSMRGRPRMTSPPGIMKKAEKLRERTRPQRHQTQIRDHSRKVINHLHRASPLEQTQKKAVIPADIKQVDQSARTCPMKMVDYFARMIPDLRLMSLRPRSLPQFFRLLHNS